MAPAAGQGPLQGPEPVEDEERQSNTAIPNSAISSAAHQAVSEKVPK
jgi:hypothetical protein